MKRKALEFQVCWMMCGRGEGETQVTWKSRTEIIFMRFQGMWPERNESGLCPEITPTPGHDMPH